VSSGPPGFSRQEVLFIALHTKISKSQRSSINTPSTKTNTEVFIMTLTDLLNQAQNTPRLTEAEILEFRAQHPETNWAEQDRQYAEILKHIHERMEEHRLKLLARRQERFRDFSGNEHK
jgi:hypothetical protein